MKKWILYPLAGLVGLFALAYVVGLLTNPEIKTSVAIEIARPPEKVSDLMADPNEIPKYWPEVGKIEIIQRIWLSWGPGIDGESPIHLWEPGQRLGWTESGARPNIVEFEIAAKVGKATLRLMQTEKMGDKRYFTLQAYLFGEATKREEELKAIFTEVQL